MEHIAVQTQIGEQYWEEEGNVGMVHAGVGVYPYLGGMECMTKDLGTDHAKILDRSTRIDKGDIKIGTL